jgi:hypothetical protein
VPDSHLELLVIRRAPCLPCAWPVSVGREALSNRLVNISTSFHAFRPHRQIDWNRALFKTSREAFVRAFARELQQHLGHPYFVVLVLHSIQCPDHHDSCNARRTLLHPRILEQRILPHLSVTFLLVTLALTTGPSFYIADSPLRRVSRAAPDLLFSFSVLPSFSFLLVRPCCLDHALRSNVWVGCLTTGSRASHASVSHLKLSRPVIRSYILKRIWGAHFYDFCIRLTESYFFITLGFRDTIRAWRGLAGHGQNDDPEMSRKIVW